MDAGRIPPAEDVERVRRTVPVSPDVRRLREVENEVAALALHIDREHKRRKKGEGRAADEALARAEAILAAAESKVRKVHTHSGREVPLAALRETALKRLEIEFGADCPILVTCAHCGKMFAVKAGTHEMYIPITCPRGCLCACGARVSRNAAKGAAKENRRAMCKRCVAAKGHAARTPEQRSAIVAKGHAAQTPEQRSAIAVKANAARTREERSAIAVKANAARTREERSAIVAKACAAKRAKAAAKTHCARGHEFTVVGRRPEGQCCECRRARRAAAKARNA